MPDFLTDPLPDPDEDGLLDLPLFDEVDDPPPALAPPPPAPVAVPRPKVQRTATVKERVMVPPHLAGEPRQRKPATKPTVGETTEFKHQIEPPPPAYRPRQRPPLALLVVLDDGREDGEVHRLRGEVTVIGRSQGDVQVPHDELISGRHAEVRRVRENGAWRWVLADLGSTNGTFVKIATLQMKSGQEIQVGHARLRFELSAPDAAEPEPPTLVEITPGGAGRRFPLTAPDNWIGSDPAGAVALGDDPLIARRHAHLYCAGGFWHLGEGSGRDGVWLRRDRVTIDKGCSFQCGEQRFLLKVP